MKMNYKKFFNILKDSVNITILKNLKNKDFFCGASNNAYSTRIKLMLRENILKIDKGGYAVNYTTLDSVFNELIDCVE